MAIYRLKSGKHHAHGKLYLPGELVELTAQEAQAFANKFELVPEPVTFLAPPPPPPFDLATASVGAVLSAIEAGIISPYEALAFEEAKEKPRKSLLEALTASE